MRELSLPFVFNIHISYVHNVLYVRDVNLKLSCSGRYTIRLTRSITDEKMLSINSIVPYIINYNRKECSLYKKVNARGRCRDESPIGRIVPMIFVFLRIEGRKIDRQLCYEATQVGCAAFLERYCQFVFYRIFEKGSKSDS